MTAITTDALPGAERTQLTLGYMRLSDSAPLLMAQELGLYEKYGLTVRLQREVSWANIRDKLITGHFDACQMLAPLPLLTTQGAAGIRAPMLSGLVLSLNGNAITLSAALWERMQRLCYGPLNKQSPAAIARAFKAAGTPHQPLTLATVHSFSTHTLLLQRWLQAAELEIGRDVQLVVVPPEQMADSLARGAIDGFCAGEPWNSTAVAHGVGVMAVNGYAVWPNAPEKVLGVLGDWHQRHPHTHLRLRLALMEACQWLDCMEHREQAIAVLARPEYLDLPVALLRPSLSGRISYARGEAISASNAFHVFADHYAGVPWAEQAEYFLQAFAGQRAASAPEQSALVAQCWREDLYREAAAWLDIAVPSADQHKAEMFL